MFYYISGTVAHVEPYLAVIDAGGVGYACHTSLTSVGRLRKGEQGRLYTYLHVREDLFELYGFATSEELNCFKMLIGISGVGPKAALSLLSAATPERLALSILAGDEKVLTSAPGIGKKLAQRVILELKDKLARSAPIGAASTSAGMPGAGFVPGGSKLSEAQAALGVLGYSASEAAMALEGMEEDLAVEEMLKRALKRMIR